VPVIFTGVFFVVAIIVELRTQNWQASEEESQEKENRDPKMLNRRFIFSHALNSGLSFGDEDRSSYVCGARSFIPWNRRITSTASNPAPIRSKNRPPKLRNFWSVAGFILLPTIK
jgi:hypothetical protein